MIFDHADRPYNPDDIFREPDPSIDPSLCEVCGEIMTRYGEVWICSFCNPDLLHGE